ncbi:MAG: hypothetical protein II207_01330 [Clostridia bacterium]|nr:hypothetical protein [Clostridia bacterium]
MDTITNKPLQDITIEDLERIAQEYSEPYDRMVKKVARHAFMEGVLWAQKVGNRQPKYTMQP